MIKTITVLLFLITTISLHSQEWTQNKEKTNITFKIKNFGVNVDGYFSDINIETNFNSDHLAQSYIHATIAVISISTGIEGRDKHILKEDYFDEPNHKFIRLKSTKVEKRSDGSFLLLADLTIKGITKQLEVPLSVDETDNSIKITSKFMVNRKDYKVGGGSFILSKKVKIQVIYSGTK